MKKLAILPLAALAVAAACSDSPTALMTPNGPQFHHIDEPSATPSASSVALEWIDIERTTQNFAGEYHLKLTCAVTDACTGNWFSGSAPQSLNRGEC